MGNVLQNVKWQETPPQIKFSNSLFIKVELIKNDDKNI